MKQNLPIASIFFIFILFSCESGIFQIVNNDIHTMNNKKCTSYLYECTTMSGEIALKPYYTVTFIDDVMCIQIGCSDLVRCYLSLSENIKINNDYNSITYEDELLTCTPNTDNYDPVPPPSE